MLAFKWKAGPKRSWTHDIICKLNAPVDHGNHCRFGGKMNTWCYHAGGVKSEVDDTDIYIFLRTTQILVKWTGRTWRLQIELQFSSCINLASRIKILVKISVKNCFKNPRKAFQVSLNIIGKGQSIAHHTHNQKVLSSPIKNKLEWSIVDWSRHTPTRAI